MGGNYKNCNYLAAKCLPKRKLFSQHSLAAAAASNPQSNLSWRVVTVAIWQHWLLAGASSLDVPRGSVLYTNWPGNIFPYSYLLLIAEVRSFPCFTTPDHDDWKVCTASLACWPKLSLKSGSMCLVLCQPWYDVQVCFFNVCVWLGVCVACHAFPGMCVHTSCYIVIYHRKWAMLTESHLCVPISQTLHLKVLDWWPHSCICLQHYI